ncbi:Mbeg1-like protein [Streptococcus dentiloxodontae]
MANLLNYVDDVKHDNFDNYPLNEVDMLVLTELGYLPFNSILTDEFNAFKGLTLQKLAEAYFQKYGDKPFSTTACKNRIRLLKKVMAAKRYQDIHAFAFVDDVDITLEKQFSAITFQLKQDYFLLAFRGTDDTLIGWKESFYITYKKEIPSQTAAKAYLEKALTYLSGKCYLTGHSKGGSLALFAAAFTSSNAQKKIANILTYDAPGLHPSLTQTDGYQAVQHQVRAFIPQDSVVGQLWKKPNEASVVRSKTWGPGLCQHDTFTWQIQNRQLVQLKTVTKGSLQVNRALNLWLKQFNEHQLQKYCDDSFDLLFTSELQCLGDLHHHMLPKLFTVIKQFLSMPQTDRQALLKAIRDFFPFYFRMIKEDLFAIRFLNRTIGE